MGLEIDDNRAELAPPFEREIINPNLGYLSNWLCWQGHNTSKDGCFARLDAQALSDPDAKSPTSCQA